MRNQLKQQWEKVSEDCQFQEGRGEESECLGMGRDVGEGSRTEWVGRRR